MALDYPTTLPCPQTLAATPFERWQPSDPNRPREARALSTDRLAVVRVTWPPLSPAEAAILQAFWKDDLRDGGAWFNATWPLPQGRVPAVFRFIEQPRWRLVPGGRWRVEAVLEQRGRTLSVVDGAAGGPPGNAWNSANELGTVVFTDADFTASFQSPSTVVSIDAAEGFLGDGKYYAELVPSFEFFEGGAANVWLGVTRDNPGGQSNGFAVDLFGSVWVDNAVVGYVGPISSGEILRIALDAASGLVYIGYGSSWLNSGDPELGLGAFDLGAFAETYYLSFQGDNIEASYSCALRTGTDRFTYAVPNGFTAWVVQGA